MIDVTKMLVFFNADKKPSEAVSNLAKRRNVYSPSSLRIQNRPSGSLMSQHGPQTPTYQGLLIMCHNSLECITSFILSMCIIYSPEPLS